MSWILECLKTDPSFVDHRWTEHVISRQAGQSRPQSPRAAKTGNDPRAANDVVDLKGLVIEVVQRKHQRVFRRSAVIDAHAVLIQVVRSQCPEAVVTGR